MPLTSAEYNRIARAERYAAGLCIECGKRPARSRCRVCNDAEALRAYIRRGQPIRQLQTCSNCHQPGHNRRGCPGVANQQGG